MKIDYLWHSELIINIKNNKWETVRILSDAWLTDYSVADIMQRNPLLNIDFGKLEKIDAIFISHSHIDHYDPYTLTLLDKNLKNKPTILLPETLEYTKPLLEKYLSFPVVVLKNKIDYEINWLLVQWIIFPDYSSTNEADVMTISVRNDEEIVYAEVDILPPLNEEWIWYIYNLFNNKKYKSKLYISTRNELEWNLSIVDKAVWERKEFAEEYKEKRIWEIYSYYETILALEEEWIKANIFELKWIIRAFIWQWIIFPAKKFWTEFLKLHMMKLQENVELETSVASEYDIQYPAYAFEWGKRYTIENWLIKNIEEIPWVSYEFFSEQENLKTKVSRTLEDKPLNSRKATQSDIDQIENYINTKFMYYQAWCLDSIKNAMIKNWRWNYIINIKINSKDEQISFIYSIWGMKFEKSNKVSIVYDEIYWANDLIDFLEWKLELYSNFVQYLEIGTTIRLWACMWANFINNDLVLKKLAYHFNLAKNWKSPEEFVMQYWK